jgi:hypothetical protein
LLRSRHSITSERPRHDMIWHACRLCAGRADLQLIQFGQLMVLGLKQLKLAAGILAALAKAGDQAGIATAIDLALKATDFGETLRTQDPVAVALRNVSAKLEEATRKALSGEFGADWENKPDLAATLAALPDVLERYAPDTDAIFAENLDPERIARRATDAAEVRGRHRLPRCAQGKNPRARAAPMGDDAEQPRHRALDARGTRERDGAPGGSGGGLQWGFGNFFSFSL